MPLFSRKSLQALGKLDLGKRDVEKALAAGYREDTMQAVYRDARP